MSPAGEGADRPVNAAGIAAARGAASALEARQRRQLLLITLGAIALFIALRRLPTGTNLSHMDFRVDPKATNAIEFCDPLNPQFIPVVAVRSPVTMTVVSSEPAVQGREVHAIVTLKTGSGKPIAPEDLLVTHTRKLHLLVVDATLADYQHVHPVPRGQPGEWSCAFLPRRSGPYRVFGDFTPAATGRGLYASADLNVAPAAEGAPPATSERGTESASAEMSATDQPAHVFERSGVRFTLTTATHPPRAGQPIDLRFAMSRNDGAPVKLEPVMGAFAHLVAFDDARSGFAHLHPTEADLLRPPDAMNPTLNFKLTIPRAGRYVIWAQVNISGEETFVPFNLVVK
jgi:hypothetical protein